MNKKDSKLDKIIVILNAAIAVLTAIKKIKG